LKRLKCKPERKPGCILKAAIWRRNKA